MKSEKRRKKLKCFEARFDSGDELPFNPDRTRLISQAKLKSSSSVILLYAKEGRTP
jgi:hypothetical protein